MRTLPECLACILGDVFVAAQETTDDQTALRVARAACVYLSCHFDYSVPPSYHITEVHRILKRMTGQSEPFAQRRRQANDAGLRLAAGVAQQAAGTADSAARFRLLAMWALAANSLDSRTAGTGYAFDPAAAYEFLFGYFQRIPALDQIDMLYRHAANGKRVLYVHDNVGEMALDGLFIKELRGHGCRVTSAVRGGPITSDATWADAIYLGLDRQADSIIVAGPDTLGISFREPSDDLLRLLGAVRCAPCPRVLRLHSEVRASGAGARTAPSRHCRGLPAACNGYPAHPSRPRIVNLPSTAGGELSA
jgi:uncharacterized protein with ATP-grasp and redox domains